MDISKCNALRRSNEKINEDSIVNADESQAHAQLDKLWQLGVNFIDTAEMYPVPSSAAGWKPGTTEEYIGTWIEKNPALRSEIVLATKVAGYNPGSETGGNRFVPPKPKADCRLDRESVLMACDASLRRLRQTISCRP